MTTRADEADGATAAFQIALTSIGVELVSDALVLWDDVPQPGQPEKVAGWVDEAVQLVMGRRTLAVQLALAYYRLVRALRTGKTIADPRTLEPKYVTLQKLRFEFRQLAEPRLSERYRQQFLPQHQATSSSPPSPNPGTGGAFPSNDDLDRILVEEIEDLREKEEADAQAADDELRIAIEQLGIKNRDALYDDIDTSRPSSEVDRDRLAAHDKAGVRQAAAGERIAMNGGRSAIWNYHDADPRCIGWIRVSLTGTPCGWCAMQISRGPVFKGKWSDGFEYADGDKYHDNCHCVMVPVFSLEEYRTGDRYALNREYEALWPKVTAGHTGKAALTVWRRYIRQQAKSRAQEAPATTNAQEA